MTRKEDILYEAISEDTSIKKVRGFSSTYPSLCNLKLFQNIDGTWLTAQDDIGVSITIKMSDLNDFVHCENLDHNSRWKGSEEKMTREEAVKIIKEWLMEGTDGLTENRLGYIEGWFHKEDAEAFDMAIKVLEQEPFINKDCVSKGACHEDKNKVLDKISAEIENQEKWLACAGYNAYNVDIAFNSIKRVLKEARDEE